MQLCVDYEELVKFLKKMKPPDAPSRPAIEHERLITVARIERWAKAHATMKE